MLPPMLGNRDHHRHNVSIAVSLVLILMKPIIQTKAPSLFHRSATAE